MFVLVFNKIFTIIQIDTMVNDAINELDPVGGDALAGL